MQYIVTHSSPPPPPRGRECPKNFFRALYDIASFMILRIYTVMHNNTYIDYLDNNGLPTILQKEKVAVGAQTWL